MDAGWWVGFICKVCMLFGLGLGLDGWQSGAERIGFWLVWIPFSDGERVWETDDEWNWLSIRGKGGRVGCAVVAGLFMT